MGDELVGSQPKNNKPRKTYKEIFEDHFPHYLMYGMTEEQYWDRDVALAIAFRKKHELEKEKKNQELWMQGLYIYEALTCVSPIFRAFSKATRPLPYPEEPHPLTVKKLKEVEKAKEERETEQAKDRLMGWANRVNKKMRERNEQS